MDVTAIAIALVNGIDMNRNEHAAVGLIGDIGALLKAGETVIVAREDDFDFGTALGDESSEPGSDVEDD